MLGLSSLCRLRCQILPTAPGKSSGNVASGRICYAVGATCTIAGAGALFSGGRRRRARAG